MAKKKDNQPKKSPRISNKKAWHDYNILEVVECGIQLFGTEVKSLRQGQGKIDEAYAKIRNGEVYLVGSTISPYSHAADSLQHEPNRDRKLLLKRSQIAKLEMHVKQKGKTVVPLAVYFKRGWAKCELGIAEGKRQYDKRHAIRDRDQKRDLARAMARRNR